LRHPILLLLLLIVVVVVVEKHIDIAIHAELELVDSGIGVACEHLCVFMISLAVPSTSVVTPSSKEIAVVQFSPKKCCRVWPKHGVHMVCRDPIQRNQQLSRTTKQSSSSFLKQEQFNHHHRHQYHLLHHHYHCSICILL